MTRLNLFERASEAAAAILEAVADPPTIAVILGSGLGMLADRLVDRSVIAYELIPHFPRPTVAGHHGNLVAGTLGAARIWILQGRFHTYEGHNVDAVTFPIRVLQRLGVRTLILTSATGGINVALAPGDLVCLEDHLNLVGANPLRRLKGDRPGTRTAGMTRVYSSALRTVAREEAGRLGMSLTPGVYAFMPGPCYETPAEIRMLRTLGADVVGMSTLPEAVVARRAGMDVLALALVSNMAAGVVGTPISHEEVLAAGRTAAPRLGQLIASVVARLAVCSIRS